MSRSIKFIFPLFLTSTFTGCVLDPADNRLIIINETNHTISTAAFLDTIPDYPALNKPEYYLSTAAIPPKKEAKQMVFGSRSGWPETIKLSKNHKLNLFVYTNDKLAKYHDMNILNTKRLYRRISLTQAQLEADNWRVKVSN